MTETNSGPRPAKSLVQLGDATTELTWLVSEWDFGLSGLMQWSPDNVRIADDGAVELVLDRAPDGSTRPYQGGETQSSAASDTGTWSWLAQAPDMEDGAVFGMFLFQENYLSDPWLEFDFEFVGSDTTKVELNIHMVNGQGERIILRNDPLVVDLGFDAAEKAHLYEIELTGNSAIFSIDDAVVATFDASDMPDNTWYSGQMRSFTNLWAAAPEMADWTGDWNHSGTPLVARIAGVGLPDNPLDRSAHGMDDVVVPQPEPDTDNQNGANNAITASTDVFEVFAGGFNTFVTITNDSGAALTPWSVVMQVDGFTIQNAWGMTFTDRGDGSVLLTGDDWGASVAQGGSVTVGFTGIGPVPGTFAFAAAGEDTVQIPDAAPAEPNPQEPDPAAPFVAADYAAALDLSMDFYYAQYSGDLPGDFPVSWRGDSALDDGADIGRDLSGGWYDAGDHVKFGLPMAFTATVLAWGAKDFAEGYKAAGSIDDIVGHIDWVNDYFLRSYDDRGTADLSDDVFHAQVGNGDIDHAYWGAAENMTMPRPVYSLTAQAPGTEVTAETAAAMASGAMVLAGAGMTERAAELTTQAEKLFAFSEAYQGSYSDAIPEAASFYKSWNGYTDELAWAASWLYEATGKEEYLAKAESAYAAHGVNWSFSWDDKSMGTAVRLAEITGKDRYFSDLDRHFDHWMNDLQRTPGTDTNDGMGYLDEWGSARYAANTAFIAVEYAGVLAARGDTGRAAEIKAFAQDQIDYVLGDNPDRFSFMVGFGDKFALNPHHRGGSGTTNVYDQADNMHTLYGALVGGPDQNGKHDDTRANYIDNEVAIDYNAGLSGALAALSMEDQFIF